MVVGLCTLELYIGEADSLKEKRRVLKSVLERVRSRFNVSIAEVGQQDLWQRATIAFACVSNDSCHTNQVISSVVNFIERQGCVQVTDCKVETL